MKILLIILTGFAAGIISGMGIGGGTILIPALSIFAGAQQKIAQSVNLFYFIPTAVCALIVHIKNKNIQIKPVIPVLISGVASAAAGAWLAALISGDVLRKMFGAFLLLLSVREFMMAFKERPENAAKK